MSEWISLADRMPKYKETVVFWVKYSNTIWHEKTGWRKRQSDGDLFVIPALPDNRERIITHWTKLPKNKPPLTGWMPLPEPPK